MANAWRISNDKRRAIVFLGFFQCLEVMGLIGTHSYLSHIHITVSRSNHTQVFFTDTFPCSSKFGNRSCRSRFGGLSAGIGIYFGIEHQHIDILPHSQHVVEAAKANIVCPAVTTKHPDGFLGQVLFERKDLFGNFVFHTG